MLIKNSLCIFYQKVWQPESLVQLLSTDYKFAVSFSILVIVLLYRPSGIFKGKVL
jgi:branched-chain amino acid transport system permease protein